ncbi:hypothetical protein NIES4071_17000 [Calothrix sp. NIES-4071]|nr:hypothetical protein NIES4071_17000 [Calothrix sp. NIES-4071]BAZ56033.1 hypothetical protein NIES4105_16950 [Calothrix sp. NIES-4105]
MILLLRNSATTEQIEQMLEEHRFYIKTAVDIERRVLAGGGDMHYDCEQVLLKDGSKQENIWGASFGIIDKKISYESMVNLRPRQNRSMEVLDPRIRERISQIIIEFLGGV